MSIFSGDELAAMGATVEHYMPDDGSGVYIKKTSMLTGARLPMHEHTYTHKSVLASGRAVLRKGVSEIPLAAPAIITIGRGEAHEVEAVTECVWLCIHASNETDSSKIDNTLVSP